MDCLICGSTTKIIKVKQGVLQVARRRRCLNPECGHLATTVEYYQEYSPVDLRVKISKLTTADVADIKTLLIQGELTYQEIADRYEVSKAQIHKIATGKSWPMIRPSILSGNSPKTTNGK